MTCALCMSFLEKCLFRSFTHFLNWIVCFSGVESCEFFIYFGDQTLVWGITDKYIFPYGFPYADVFFSHTEAFYFDQVPFVYSFLYVPCSRGLISENIVAWNIWSFLPRFSYRTFEVSCLIFSLLSILNLFLCMV